MQEEKARPIITGSNSNVNYAIVKSLTQKDMLVYKHTETEEMTSYPPLDKMFTINNYESSEYKSGRELRRERRKQQRKNK